jgi:hypothetical protein
VPPSNSLMQSTAPCQLWQDIQGFPVAHVL